MFIKFVEKCSDFNGPCLDIFSSNKNESFQLGIIFEKISSRNKCVWTSFEDENVFIRIPIIDMV